MLTLMRLRGKNVGCFKELDVPLHKQGLTFLSGQDRDSPVRADGSWSSNGSGKTTLFELLTHAIYQNTHKGGSKNRLLNKFAPKNFELFLDFKRDGIPYRIEQYRNHKEFKTSLRLIENGTPIHAEGTKAIAQTQRRVEARVGLSLGEWFGFVYLAQNATHAMVSGTPAEKKRYLTRVFGVDVLDAYDRNISVFLSSQKQTQQMLEEAVAAKAALKTELAENPQVPDEEIRALKDRRKSLQRRVDEAAALLAAVKQTRDRDANKPTLEKHGLLTAVEGKDDAAIKALLVKDREALKALDAQAEKTERRVALLAKMPADTEIQPKEAIALLEKRAHAAREKLNELQTQRSAYDRWKQYQEDRQAISPLDDATLEAVDPSKSYRSRLEKLDAERAVLRNELKTLQAVGGRSTCPECLQDVSESHVRELRERKKPKLAALEAERAILAAKHAKQEALEEAAKRYRVWKSRSVPKAERVSSSDIQTAQDKLKVAEVVLENSRKVVHLSEELEQLGPEESRKAVAEREADQAKLKQRIDLLSEVRKFDWTVPTQSSKQIEKQQKKLHRKLARAQHDLTTAEHQNTLYRERIEKLKEARSRVTKLEGQTQRTRHAEVLRVALADVKHARLKEATRVLTSVLPGYVSEFFPSKQVAIHIDESKPDKLDLLFEKGGKLIPLDDISGGQAKRLAVSIVLSFTKLTAQTVNLLVADEPFQDLDPGMREVCFDLLKDANVPTTIITSHDLDIAKKRYDQRWTVVHQNHISTFHRKQPP